MGKKPILLVLVLTLSPLITPIAIVTVGQANDPIPGIELKYRTPHSLPQGWIYVLVETPVFDGINSSLNRYATDLESIDGFSVGIYTVSTNNTTAIRSLLQQALPEGLVGSLLVGDIPAAYYQYGPPGDRHTFTTDFYYMDLDGVWSDTDNDGVYDKHSGEFGAEIWIGRLQPSSVSGDPIWLLNNYFEKNHLYRTSKLTLPKRALVYADVYYGEEWANLTRIAYDETVLINDPKTTNASDYRKRLVEGYEWISLECHGSPGSHTFLDASGGWDGTLTGLDYREIDPHTFFYVFDVCNAASEKTKNNLVSSVVFANTSGLLAIGPKDLDYKWGPDATFYEALSEGKSIGEAYLEDIKFYEYERKRYPEWGEGVQIPVYEYWWVMVGDPSLPINGYPRYKLTVTSSPVTGVTFTVGSLSRTTPWSGTYSEGSSVSLVMPENRDGYVWSHWLAYASWYGPFEDRDTNRIKTVTMNTDIVLTAVFTPDTTLPTVSVVSPENKAYPVNRVPLTFTVGEPTSWVGYSLNGQTNVTISGNTTIDGLSNGVYTITVYANDTAGNMGCSDTVYFTIDTVPPNIEILSPENKTYTTSSVPLSFIIDEAVSWVGYSLNGQTNVTIAENTTLPELSDGSYSLIIYAKDTAGNIGASEISYFSIETQQAEPLQIWIVAVTVTITGVGAALLVYFTKVKKTTDKAK